MTVRTALILSLTTMLTFAAGIASGKYSGGSGTVEDPYRIATAEDLTTLAGAGASDWAKSYVLVNDIDLAGVSMSPIANNVLAYIGVFDGNDHVIRNMTINMPGSYWIGLIGYLGPGGQVKNLGIVDANLHGAGDMGCIAGYSEGSITSCYATGVVEGTEFAVGGLVGYMWLNTTLTSSYAAVNVTAGGNYAGGLAAISYGRITNCYATGSVSGSNLVGGLVGANGHTYDAYIPLHYYGEIISCYSTGAVSGTGSYVGSFVGLNESDDGKITDCFWNTQTSGLPEGVGSGISTGIYGKTTAEMQTQSTFTDAGWDFIAETANGSDDIWKMPFDGGYPMLSWQDTVTIGKGEGGWYIPFDSFYYYSRAQIIYLSSEIGGPRTLRSLAVHAVSTTGSWMQNFTIRVKHTNLSSYASNVWETSDWTTVYQSNLTVSTDGWKTFIFTTPFEYNGTDNLMVDMSFNSSNGASSSFCYYSVPGGNRTIYYNAFSSASDPLTWSGSSPMPVSESYVPNIRLGFDPIVTINVPDIVGHTQADANSAIIAAGLTIGTITSDYNDTVPAGHVISQNPAAGTTAQPNTAVDFVVSLGVEEVSVPNVVGLTEADASSAVLAAGLVVGDITYGYSNSILRSSVMSQNPAAGAKAAPGTDVNIVLSLGKWMDFTVTKCTVTAGAKYNTICDSISFSGVMDANDSVFLTAGQIIVTVTSDEPMDPCVMTFPISAATFKKGSYGYTIKGSPFSSSFKFSTKTKAFSLSAKNINLTGLDCPITVSMRIGNSLGNAVIDETIVNGTKKLIPYQLMMGVQDSLIADKVSVKRSAKADADSLKITGRFTTSGEPDLVNPLVIKAGSLTFTVTGDKFINKKGVISCKSAVANEGAAILVTATLDYMKCTYSINVKNINITQSGVVDFGINCFGDNLDGLETINLGSI